MTRAIAQPTLLAMRNVCLTIARLALAAWIGAAALFVCTSISEQVSIAYDSGVKNTLAAIRFPWYYGFGFCLVTTGGVCGVIGLNRRQQPRRWMFFGVSLSLALILMIVDYFTIYSPLHAIVTHPDGVRDAQFERLHRWSEQINTVDVTLCLLAALAICWPECRNSKQ